MVFGETHVQSVLWCHCDFNAFQACTHERGACLCHQTTGMGQYGTNLKGDAISIANTTGETKGLSKIMRLYISGMMTVNTQLAGVRTMYTEV